MLIEIELRVNCEVLVVTLSIKDEVSVLGHIFSPVLEAGAMIGTA